MNDFRFYVYHLTDGPETVYVGKGTGRRLKSQLARTGLFGEILKRFKSERDAYAHERRLIKNLAPRLNKIAGGGGPVVRRRVQRKPKWQRDIESVGTRIYAARELLKLDLRGFVNPEQLAAIKCVASTI